MTSARLPLVAMPGCSNGAEHPDKRRSSVGHKYASALTDVAGVLPVMIPAMSESYDLSALVERIDGLFLTGGVSNIEPLRYGREQDDAFAPFDSYRDALSLALVRECLQQGKPVLGVCRGLQELNVALGGTLRNDIQEEEGCMDHRDPTTGDPSVDYAAAHSISVVEGGVFSDFLKQAEEELPDLGELRVNSLHRQAIADLAPSLKIEATAADGVIEAVSGTGESFCFAVQWHPEYGAVKNELSKIIFEAFGKACKTALFR
ncbi:gamma-glutamyl-gamma-aminobutyrate hydrolase family protein [Kiloniella sp. b19]|uniref:gamma-glutamyl-gamma-aminobutyrate hydrolase family protein n=1 Tax=Kiloniella sp. GXU_MW_B19 TaxID=3141326 RepID=UPI0031DCDD6D